MYYEINSSGHDEPNVDSLANHRVPKGHRPDAVDADYASCADSLKTLGFEETDWYLLDDQQHCQRAYLAAFRHQSGVALARVWRRISIGSDASSEPAQVTFLSKLNDGTFLLSTSQFSDLSAPPRTAVNQLVGASTDELWESHVRKLAASLANQPTPISNRDQAAIVLEQYHQCVRDSYLEHGVFQAADENAVPVAAAVAVDGATDATAAYAPILAEIERLQDKRPGWGNAIFILGFSLLIFFGAGAAVWSWQLVLVLVPILLFHELGHYIAMRVFGYRNLRMFFIPLFGAAVSGRHYNVPGWKKAIVSLAGPLPGIALGMVLGAVAMVVDQRWLLETSLMMMFLNGFNLLPFLPLDGGWVAHAILFSRSPVLDAGFRVLAAVALIVGGLALDTRILPLVGVFMLFGVPMAFRIARVAVNIRRERVAADTDGDRIPPAAACRIIDELRTVMPSGMSSKQLAQTTMQVFENANARPPGLLASLGFGALHLGTLAALLILPVIAIVVQQVGFGGLFGEPREMPRYPLSVEEIRSVEPPEPAPVDSESRTTVLATFPTTDAARVAYAAQADSLPDGARLKLFGQSVILDLPDGHAGTADVFAEQFRSEDAEVAINASPFDTWWDVDCIAPSEQVAQEIEDQARLYFEIPLAMCAIPPWSPEHDLTERHLLARRTYQQLNRGPDLDDDATLMELSNQLDRAYEMEDDALIERLEEEYSRRETDLMAEYRERLRNRDAEQVHGALIDAFEAMPQYVDATNLSEAEATARAEEYTKRVGQWQLTVGAHMGQLPLLDGQEEPGAQRYSTTGYVRREGTHVFFVRLPFVQMYDGPQALIGWLNELGCTDYHYGFLADDWD